MNIRESILLRVKIAFGIALGIAVLIISQIIYIQFVQGSKWKELAREMSLSYRVKKATRGNIYATKGELLATSIPLYKLSMDPVAASEEAYGQGIDSLSRLLAGFFKDQPALDYLLNISNARKQKRRYIVLSNRLITFIDKKKMEEWPIFNLGQMAGGVIFEKVDERSYPFDNLGRRTIGFVNENDKGAGLELSLNKELSGIDGRALYQKITGGQWKPVNSGTKVRPTDGYDIHTSIDVNIQDVVEKTLQKALKRHQASYGCAVVMEVKTGEVKAMANLGLVNKAKFEYAENYNYAIGDIASDDPGSIFKIASMMALLEDTTLSHRDTIETGGGSFRYFDRVMKDTRYGGWGRLTLQQAVEYSSNIGVSRLISRHFGRSNERSDRFVEYMSTFGLTRDLGKSFLLEGMSKAYIKNTQDQTWSGVTLPWMSVGYETKISPLQMLMFFNAIANDGYLIEPILVKKITQTGKVVEKFERKPERYPICSKPTLQKIQDMLEGVVLRGTAQNIQSKRYQIAGKTGTSQKLNKRGRYTKKYKTSFVGYFPANNPRYSCIVMIDEPKGANQYGGDVSAPVFREIADQLYDQDVEVQSKMKLIREAPLFQTNLPTQEVLAYQDAQAVLKALEIPYMPNEGSGEWVQANPKQMAVAWENRKLEPNKIPNLKGLSLRDAIYLLENKGLKVYYSGQGRVKSQSLMPGAALIPGDKIVIQLE